MHDMDVGIIVSLMIALVGLAILNNLDFLFK